jgi:hypothetical protein
MNIDDFIRGQKDCKAGKPHEAGKSNDYNRGYAAQYELEQAQAWWSMKGASHGR